jgi:sortase A
MVLVAAGAACGRAATESRDVPSSTLGRGPRTGILAPPTTAAIPPTTVPVVHTQPVYIPRDSYAPEPVKEIGTIEIPALGLVHPAFEGVTLQNIDLGPSHWIGTAEPGQPGNTVFAGHRITNSHPFRDLDQLVAGDEVIFTVDGVRSVYKVTGSMVVTPDETWIADQTPGATGTLYACHPPGSVAYRFVVKMALVT